MSLDDLRSDRSDIAFMEDLILQSADPFIYMDTSGTIRLWNRGAELLFGWRPEEIIGRRIDVLLPEKPDLPSDLNEFREHVHEGVVVQNFETALRARSGREIPVTITITLIRDGDDTVLGSTVTVRDVTREKSLERQLRWRTGEMDLLDNVVHAVQESLDLERILRIILTSVTAGSGLGFNRAILFLIAGNAIEAQLGIGASSWEEAARLWPRVANLPDLQSVIDHVLGDEEHEYTQVQTIIADWRVPLDKTESALVQCVRDMQARVRERSDTDDVAVRLDAPMYAIVPLVSTGEVIGAIVADNAVTHKPIDEHAVRLLRLLANEASSAIANARLYQQLLDHARDLEEAYRQIRTQQNLIIQGQHMSALGEIVEAISHEVKGPLVPIGGFARVMRRGATEGSDQANMLDIIIKETERLERVVKGVIALAKPPEPAIRRVSIAGIVEDVYALYRAEAADRCIELALDIPPRLPMLSLDSDQWHQLFLNLIANAIAATPNGGTITVAVRQMDDGWFRISLSDTGIGVDPADIPRVFSAFYSSKPTGSSMGLNIVAQIIQLHHGRVTVESAVGKGTTIHVDVPPPDVLESLLAEERKLREASREELGQLDPLTIAALRRSNRSPVAE